MRFETLEFIKRRERRILIIQMYDKTDRHEPVFQMIQEGATTRRAVERPAEGMGDESWLMFGRINLPEFFQTNAEFGRLAPTIKVITRNGHFRERTACAFCEQSIFAAQFHAARETIFHLAFARDTHVTGRYTRDAIMLIKQQFSGSKARINFNAEFFGLGREIARDIGKRADEIAVIVHQRRHEHIGQTNAARWPEQIETVFRHFCLQWAIVVLAPFGQELVEADRVNHRA